MKIMRGSTRSRRCFAGLPASLLLLLLGCQTEPESTTSRPFTTARVGWQVAWATQGQLAQVLQRTNALALNRLRGDFKSFTYGAPLSEAALAGDLDVAFVGDQPAINLISKSRDWTLVARLMDFRVALVVPPISSVKEIRDLRGKVLGIPFGSSTHRFALQALEEAGLDPESDLKILNIDIQEQADIVNAGGGSDWPNVDAFASWDHHIALYESRGLARILKSGTALGVVAMSDRFMRSDPDAASGFLAAFRLASYYYAIHPDQADQWFAEAAQGQFDLNLLRQVAAIEPNLGAKRLDEVNIRLSDTHLALLQSAADFAAAHGLIKMSINVRGSIDLLPAVEADRVLASDATILRGLEATQ